MKERLWTIWVGSYKIRVSVVKGCSGKAGFFDVPIVLKTGGFLSVGGKGKSYVDMVCQNRVAKIDFYGCGSSKFAPASAQAKGQSSRDFRGNEFSVKEEDVEWVKGYYVGRAHATKMVPIIQTSLSLIGVPNVSMKLLGGKLVLLSTEDKYNMKEFVEKEKGRLS
ncbi:hypothetical protein Ancab_039379 [Ancistrocladus abbreviatus]